MELGLSQFFLSQDSSHSIEKPRFRAYLLYALIGALWIMLSDRVLLSMQISESIVELTAFQTVKGWLFVLSTALIFYAMGRRRADHLQNAADNLTFMGTIARDTYDIVWRGDPELRDFRVLHYSGEGDPQEAANLIGEHAVHPDDLSAHWETWTRGFAEQKQFADTVRLKVGAQYRYFESRVYPITNRKGEVIEWCGACRDVDNFVRSNLRIKRNEEMLRLAAEAGGIGVWDWDIGGNTLHVSEEMRRQHGSDIATPSQLKSFIHDKDYPAVRKIMLAAKRDCAPFSVEYRISSRNQGVRWILNKGEAFAEEGSRRMVGISMDITQMRTAQERFRHLAYHDSLTELPNRRGGEEFLSQAVSAAGPHGEVAACILDIDYFGMLNETQGPAVGDMVLRAVAKRLSLNLDKGEHISRYSADVFLLVMPDFQSHILQERLEALKFLFGRPFEVLGNPLYISVTGGVAVYRRDAHDSQELLRAAQTALYRAKENSRGTIGEFDFTMLARTERFTEIRNALSSAIDSNEFQLHYQPQYDLHSGKISGLEGLLRWHSAALGSVSPAEFIPVAERVGLIGDIDSLVLNIMLRQIRTWQREGKAVAPVGFNLSPVCLERKGNAEYIRDMVYRYGLSPDSLVLEVTETAIIHDVRAVRENLIKLGSYGFPIAIDDFGTGYSSLDNLQRFPIHKVKIDKSFVQHIENSESHANMTRGIIHMTHDMGLHVIAEGVESEEQATLLREWGCDTVQGYLYARPMPAAEVSEYL